MALARMEVGLNTCLTSPKLRARETARLACVPLGLEPEETERLRGGPFDALDLGAGRAAWQSSTDPP